MSTKTVQIAYFHSECWLTCPYQPVQQTIEKWGWPFRKAKWFPAIVDKTGSIRLRLQASARLGGKALDPMVQRVQNVDGPGAVHCESPGAGELSWPGAGGSPNLKGFARRRESLHAMVAKFGD